MHLSIPATRLIPAPSRLHLSNREHGTRVTIQNLFGSMPVRVKQRALESASGDDEKHLESLKKQVIGLLLAWHMPVTISLKSTKDNKTFRIRSKKDLISSEGRDERPSRILDLSLVCSIFSQAGYIEPSDWGDWIKISARTPLITIKGAISLRPAPSKNMQFFSLGLHSINAETGSNILYDEINRLFTSSSFGNQEETSDTKDSSKAKSRRDGRFKKDGFTNKQLKGEGKGVDRWPMFYIRIEIQSPTNTGHEDDVEKLGESMFTGLTRVLGAMITGFLDENHFRPRARPRARKQPEPRPPKLSGRSIGFQNTMSNIGPTNWTKNKLEDDTFSTWGRIKSGFRVKSSGKSLPLSSPASQPIQAKSDIVIATSPQIDLNATSNVKNTDDTEGNETSTHPHEETTMGWRNPISGATVRVNARTGLVIPDRPSRRPATAPSSLGSLKLPTATNLRTNAPPNAEKRLTRTTSPPLGITRAGSWSSDLLKRWENPVFDITEKAIPQVSLDGPPLETSDVLHGRRHCCSDLEIQKAFTQSSSYFSAKLSRQALGDAQIIAQVDQKFVLVCMSGNPSTDDPARKRPLLVLVDQHAADERIRVERLLADLDSSPTLPTKPITFELPDRERALLARHVPYFSSWGIIYNVERAIDASKCKLTVKALPAAIAERCRIEPKVLIELLRGEAWKREELGLRPIPVDQGPDLEPTETAKKESWLTRLSSCPQGLLDMLNSRACRSAIMFNDQLTISECQTLIQRLAECAFPFQCAHGRPSMVP